MIDNRKRQSLTTLAAGFVASCLPFQVQSASDGVITNEPLVASNDDRIDAFNKSGKVDGIKVTVSTLGMGSAVTTLTNQSNKTVTVIALSSGIVLHNEMYFNTNAAIGRAGITLKAGQRRILVAQRANGHIC